MTTIKHIYICSDFLMTKEKEQHSNLQWLYEVLQFPLNKACNLDVHPFLSCREDNNPSQFSRDEFFSRSNIQLDLEAMHFYFDSSVISTESIDYLLEFIDQSTLIIGYELSKETRRLLNNIGITYIDIWLHPIRFIDDILFAFSSNNHNIFGRLGDRKFNEDYYYMYAGYLKACSHKGFRPVEIDIKPNSALFAGQSLQDKALCHKGKMLNIMDFRDELLNISQSHDQIYYSIHPNLTAENKQIKEFLKEFQNIEISINDTYHMLCNPNISNVYSISSSVSQEAKYFGKESHTLYQPIINLSKEHEINNYISIFHDFISPDFWADILSPIIETNSVRPIQFLSPKDKLRDMTRFIYGYKDIDKLEFTRNKLKFVDKRVQKIDQTSTPTQQKKFNPHSKHQHKHQELIRRIKQHKVISFDIFDTLLVRPFCNSDDVLKLIEESADKIIKNDMIDFVQERKQAKSYVKSQKGVEEITLQERYQALGYKHRLSREQVQKLLELEMSADYNVVYPRTYVYQLYKYALEMKKTVVFTSDTYYPESFIKKLLHKNGYRYYHKLYLSSEIKLLKRSGNLFHYLVKDTQCSPEQILHIGDDLFADIKQSKPVGISSFHVPRASKEYLDNIHYAPLWKESVKQNISVSIIQGIIANKFYDNPFEFKQNTYCNSSAYFLGYSCLGPLCFSFVQWLILQANSQNINRLYFLSRDGEILYKTYELLSQVYSQMPDAKYIHASRRALYVATIYTVSDILSLTEINFSPSTLKDFMLNRFGFDIQSQPKEKINLALNKADLQSISDIIQHEQHLPQLKTFVLEFQDTIMIQARTEREVLLSYYDSCGLKRSYAQNAIVDIGHRGSLQVCMSRLLNESIHGFYFATQEPIKDNISNEQMQTWTYFAQDLDPTDTQHPYSRYLLMFELLFLNEQGSLIKMNQTATKFETITQPTTQDSGRTLFIQECHRGCLDFIRELIYLFGENTKNISITPWNAARSYISMLQHPTRDDAEIFRKVQIESLFNNRNYRNIISDKVWEEGYTAVFNNPITKPDTTTKNSEGLATYFNKHTKRFFKDPHRFLSVTKFKPIRPFRHFFSVK